MTPQFNFTVETVLTKVTREQIGEIRTWTQTQNDVTIPDLCDEQIALFLLSCNNDRKYTQNTISAYYKIKRNAPELFDDRDLDRSDLLHQLTALLVLFVGLDLCFVHYQCSLIKR